MMDVSMSGLMMAGCGITALVGITVLILCVLALTKYLRTA